MARKTFTQAVKQQAVAEMSIGNLTQKQIAEKYGCSVPALQVWRRELQDNPPAEEEEWEEEEWAAEEAPETCECDCQCTQQDAQELMRQFWSKGNRAVDMLLTPKAVSAEDAVKLVNEALQFACDQK